VYVTTVLYIESYW